jgi:hypothetical protein
MSEPTSPTPPAPPRSAFNNWISAIGAVLAGGALFSFALLVAMSFIQGDKNPYLGILTYIVAPAFLIGGLLIVVFGAWLQRRYAIKHAANRPDRWQLDLHNPRQRRHLIMLAGGTCTFLLLSAFGSYQTYHYAESVQFCGEVCHKAMKPEHVTYQRGSHSRVSCVECHIGSGVEWFFKAKINGAHQLIAYAMDNYNRPIATPVKNLRPARDICEQCHWPEKFLGNLDVTFEHFMSDKKNTPYAVRMLMKVNSGRPGAPMGGIHWHVSPENKVEYYAIDDKRQDIVWMRVTNTKDGSEKIFRNEEFKGEPPVALVRSMDCVDCHNRPAHVFPTANDSVEQSMALGRINTTLPNIKRYAVQAMLQKEITTSAEAPTKIADYLRNRYKDAAGLQETITEVQRIYAESIFPERKADWRVYPNNIGHKDWPGCFRCHDDKHKTASGETVRASDCSSCHVILAQGKTEELATLTSSGLEFKHPGGSYDEELRCADCHNGGIQGK